MEDFYRYLDNIPTIEAFLKHPEKFPGEPIHKDFPRYVERYIREHPKKKDTG